MKFHTISGTPRSGSTLLCNILNQNPLFYASDTSNLPQMCRSVSQVCSTNIETKNLLNQDKEGTLNRINKTIQGVIYNWYLDKRDKTVFDKSRGWTSNNLLLNQVSPESKQIICVRDLREIFASTEKQYRKTAIVADIVEDSLTRADVLFKEDGMVGGPMKGVESIIRSNAKNIYILQFNELVSNPEKVMKEIYTFIEEEYFEHDFNNVINQSKEADGFYLWKYPHTGSGKVEPQDTSNWKQYVPDDVEQAIMSISGFYNSHLRFGNNTAWNNKVQKFAEGKNDD